MHVMAGNFLAKSIRWQLNALPAVRTHGAPAHIYTVTSPSAGWQSGPKVYFMSTLVKALYWAHRKCIALSTNDALKFLCRWACLLFQLLECIKKVCEVFTAIFTQAKKKIAVNAF